MLPSTSSEAPNTPLNKIEFLGQQFQHTAICLIPLVEKVDDHHIMQLTIAVATADPLLNPLGIPRQVVVDDQRTKLDIHAFSRRFRGNQDAGLVSEMLDQGGANINVTRARNPTRALD
jgi:hypothetical protein